MPQRDLLEILQSLDEHASAVQRHLLLAELLDWLRGPGVSATATLQRLQLLLDALAMRPPLQARLALWWQALLREVDLTALCADHGLTQHSAYVTEFFRLLMHKALPLSPQTQDGSALVTLVLDHGGDAQWLAAITSAMAQRIGQMLGPVLDEQGAPVWNPTLEDALTYCVSQIRSIGFAPQLRQRMDAHAQRSRPFHYLAADLQALLDALHAQPTQPQALALAVQRFEQRLDACRHAAASVYAHLDEHGISVDMVFRLRQLRQRVLRVRALLQCRLSDNSAHSAVQLLAQLVQQGQQSRSVSALIASSSSLLAAKITERSAEVGEHYIARDCQQYSAMLRKAAGGGAVLSLTTFAKFAIMSLALSAFWSGLLVGLNYALSFVLIQLLHWTVATKQPAMTAPALAAKLKAVDSAGGVERFVDEVTHLVRSQVAAVLGNLALVVPCVLLLGAAWQALTGTPALGPGHANYVLSDLTLLGPTALFAAFTGVLLFASSMAAGWVENWFVLHQLESALSHHRRLTRWLGAERAQRWAQALRCNISGLAANISLGLMLGLVPAVALFFGLGLEVRHVTLSAGQLSAAAASLGLGVLGLAAFWWCVAALLVTATLNIGVSFYLAFRLALQAHHVSPAQRLQIKAALRSRLRSAPMSWLLPPRTPPAPPPGPDHG